ncbi:MAG TPA: HAD-IIA family hydrolase [Anaerolineae bacterium]|nr:HAD-IIA family hydrolase [Anaerolineae bacterium]
MARRAGFNSAFVMDYSARQYGMTRSSLSSLQALIIDMDGVLWRGSEALPGITDFFAFLRRRAIRFVLATNNASRTEAQYAERLASYGAAVAIEEIVTSSTATAEHLTSLVPRGSRVYAIGMDGVREALAKQGFVLSEGDEAAAVVVGIDWHVTYERLKRASLLIRAGAKFVGTNPDATYPAPEGIIPGNGALLAAIETATGVKPIVVGKPEPILYQQAIQRLGTPLDAIAALGDRLETDILGGIRAGIKTILVMSGVTTPEQLAASEYRPDWVFEDILDLMQRWEDQ